jgi:hypothetical protein
VWLSLRNERPQNLSGWPSALTTKENGKMKTTKTQAVLLMYRTLRDSGCLRKEDILMKVEISDLTFRRYISELRCFFMNFDEPEEIIYVKAKDAYFLSK